MVWDPAQYLKFADQRLRPAVDLLARGSALRPLLAVLRFRRLFIVATRA